MTEDDDRIVDVLRGLLAAEQRGLPARLLESTVFVDPVTVEELNAVNEMARAGRQHVAGLTQLILDLGGAPVLRAADVTSADLHYQSIRVALPRLIQDTESLIGAYADAAKHLSDEPLAARLVSDILSRHEEELRSLQRLGGQQTAPAV